MSREYILVGLTPVYVSETGSRQEILANGSYLSETVAATAAVNSEWLTQATPIPQPRFRAGAMAATGVFLVLMPPSALINNTDGWEVQSPQPPHERSEVKAAAFLGGDDTRAPLVNWKNTGWEIQPFQPPHREPENKAAAWLRGDDGTQAQFVFWKNTGWEIQPVQPPHREPEIKGAAFLRGDDGNQARFAVWKNTGFEVQPFQPPHRETEIKAAAFLKGDDGNQGRFFVWKNAGWEIQSWQPPHERSEQKGAILYGDNGIQGVLSASALLTSAYAWGYDEPFVYPRRNYAVAGAIAPRDDYGHQAPFVKWINDGWEIQSVQPPQVRSEKAGCIQPWINVEVVYVNWRNAGWEIQSWQPPHERSEQKFAAIVPKSDGNDAPFLRWLNAGWEVQSVQPPHLKTERSSVQFIGDSGIEGPMITGLQTATYPFGIDGPFLFPRKPFNLAGAIMPRSDGIDARFFVWCNTGWEIQPPPPPHRGQEFKSAAFMRGDDGMQAPFILWRNGGWEVAPFQPPHIKIERNAVYLRGSDGTDAPMFSILPTAAYAFGYGDPFLFPRKAFERGAAIAPHDDGTYARFVNWRNMGFEVQPVQPPHRGAENRWPAILYGDQGNQDRFTFWRVTGWEIAPYQPQHRAIERMGALFGSDPGNQGRFSRWINAGWEFVPPQPKHPLRERSGALFGGDFGAYRGIIIVRIRPQPTLLGAKVTVTLLADKSAPELLGSKGEVDLLGKVDE